MLYEGGPVGNGIA